MGTLIARAVELAKAAHHGAVRGDGFTPYIMHPMAVANTVATAGGSEDAIAAAWLHDTIEDTSLGWSDINELVSTKVADLVMELTFPSRPNRRALMLDIIPGMSRDAKLVKLADAFNNLNDLPTAKWDRGKVDRYYKHLLAVRKALSGTNPLLERSFDLVAEAMEERLKG